MIAVAGAGQYPIYQTLPGDSTLVRIKPKYDTIPIIYLYADTARLMSIAEGWYIKNNIAFIEKDTSYYPPHFYAFWDFGYEVVEGKILWRIGNDGSRIPLFNHITYLDRHHQPLRKSIVIWQTKTIIK